MKQKAFEIMSSISKSDKQIWENYISNFKSFSFNFQNNKKDLLNTPKKTLSKRHLKPFKNCRFSPEAVIDLHGYRLATAKIILFKYIINAFESKIRNILIITGKGLNNKGVLKKEVPLWLNDKVLTDLLINYETAPRKLGGEGALLVRIKNKNKSRLI